VTVVPAGKPVPATLLRRVFSPAGRQGRKSYFTELVLLGVVGVTLTAAVTAPGVLAALGFAVRSLPPAWLQPLSGVIQALLLTLAVIAGVRRLRDAGLSPAYMFLLLIPFFGLFVLLALHLAPPAPGAPDHRGLQEKRPDPDASVVIGTPETQTSEREQA